MNNPCINHAFWFWSGIKQKKPEDKKKPETEEEVQEILADTSYTMGMLAASMQEETKKVVSIVCQMLSGWTKNSLHYINV